LESNTSSFDISHRVFNPLGETTHDFIYKFRFASGYTTGDIILFGVNPSIHTQYNSEVSGGEVRFDAFSKNLNSLEVVPATWSNMATNAPLPFLTGADGAGTAGGIDPNDDEDGNVLTGVSGSYGAFDSFAPNFVRNGVGYQSANVTVQVRPIAATPAAIGSLGLFLFGK
jgi:hypothetical protein